MAKVTVMLEHAMLGDVTVELDVVTDYHESPTAKMFETLDQAVEKAKAAYQA